MDNINIREYIINNFKNDDTGVIRKAIEGSIEEQDEVALPGMGVFLELIWNGADENLKNTMLQIIERKIKG